MKRVATVVTVLLLAARLPGEAVDLDQAIRQVLANHPIAVAAGHALVARTSEARRSARWPDAALMVEVEGVAGSGVYRGGDARETMVLALLPLALDQGRRSALAGADIAAAEAQRRVAGLDLAAVVAQRHVAALEARARAALLAEDARLLQDLTAAGRGRVAAGDLGMNAALLVEVEAQVAANAAARARGEAESALQRWRRLGLDGEPAAPDDAPFAAEGLETLVERHPAVIAATAALTSVERARRSLGAGAWSPRIGIGARHDAGLGDHALVLGLELPLANARAVGDDRRAATARVAAAQAQRDGERLRILDELATARAELVSAGDAVTGLLPLLQRSQTAVESAVRAHADGALGDLDLIATRRAALTVRRLVSEAQVEVWKATIALRQASGTLLPSME